MRQTIIRRTREVLIGVLFIVIVTARAAANDLTWNGTGLLFDLAWSWTPNQAPTAADNVFFDINAPTVIFGAPSLALNVNILDNSTTFTGGAGTSLTNAGIVTIDDAFAVGLGDGAFATLNATTWDSAGNAIVGDTGFGTFAINSGGDFRALNVIVGDDIGSAGVINVDGAGSTLQTDALNDSDGFFIGNSGTGTLNVTGGGLARIVNDVTGGIANFHVGNEADGEGTLNIDGPGSSVIAEDVFVGNFGTGHLSITDGGLLNQNIFTSPDAFVAQQVDSSGDVTVHGDGSQWLMARLEIGNLGDGILSVEAGGFVRSNSNDTTLGDAGGSGRVAVFGAGVANSTLDVTNDLYVGNLGLGELFVGQDLNGTADGNGTLDVGSDLLIGSAASNNLDNKVVVSGANASAMVGGNLIAGGTINAGLAGTGIFEARNGATITVGGVLAAGGGPDSDGTIVIDGLGTTLTSGWMELGNANGGASSTGIMTVSDQAVVTFTSTTNGVVTVGDDSSSVGTLTVTGAGSLVQSTGGTAEWWIGGSNNDPGGTGKVNVLDGGQVITTGRVILGHGNLSNSGSSGTLLVDGTGSQLDANGDIILVGFVGVGNMDVTGGGVVNANNMFVADATGSAGSQLDIDGFGSVVNIDGLLHVGDSARGVVNVTGGGQLNVATGNLANRLIIGDETATDASRLTVSGAGSRVDYFGTDRVSVGFVGGGSFGNPVILEVLDGSVFEMEHAGVNSSIGLFVADEANSAGLVTVDGSGSLLHTSSMNVSDSTNTQGTVNITNGGIIDVDDFVEIGSAGDGDGFLTVSGAGSRLEVGSDLSAAAGASNLRVDGTITITDGGAVTNGDQGFIGRASTNVGTVNVGGPGALATWDVGTDLFIAGNDSLTVGGSQTSGSGTLNVLANGQVTVNSILVLKDRGVINLDGGELAADDILFQDFPERTLSPTVNFNSGTLRFLGNATLNASFFTPVLGPAPTLVADQHLDVDGVATLNTTLRLNGGTFSVGSITAANLANLDFDAGTFNLTNANLTVGAGGIFGSSLVIDTPQSVNVTNQATINAGAQLVAAGNFSSGGLTNNGDLVAIDSTIGGNVVNNNAITVVGTVDFNGQVSGPGNFFGPGTANFNGSLAPGASPAIINFEGNLALTETNTLFIEISGLTPGSQHDQLVVAGNAALDGILNVSLVGFAPTIGQQFTVLTADSIDNNGLMLGGSSANQFSLMIDSSSVTLQAIAAGLTGDYNQNGTVDVADYTVWRDNLGAAAGTLPNDPLGSAIGQAQYDQWKASFGASLGAASAAAAVPEPTTTAFLIVGVVWLIGQRWRSWR